MKLGMDYHFTTKRKTIEGIFEIRPQTKATGPPRGDLCGGKNDKKFFFIFLFFLIGITEFMSELLGNHKKT